MVMRPALRDMRKSLSFLHQSPSEPPSEQTCFVSLLYLQVGYTSYIFTCHDATTVLIWFVDCSWIGGQAWLTFCFRLFLSCFCFSSFCFISVFSVLAIFWYANYARTEVINLSPFILSTVHLVSRRVWGDVVLTLLVPYCVCVVDR